MKKTKEENYKEHDELAGSMGLIGEGGHYRTPLGLEIDTTATNPDRLAFGYLIAKTAGHITNY